MRGNKKIYAVFGILATVILGTTYFTLSEINSLRNDLKNLELSFALNQKERTVITEATSTPEIKPSAGAAEGVVAIPTAIIFDVLSSPVLAPQTKITVTVESIAKTKEGEVIIGLKAFTNEAEAYSALEPKDIFGILDLTSGAVDRPFKVDSTFASIPPKSAAAGKVSFKVSPEKQSIILELRYDGNLKHYEINFERKNYQEAILG